MILKEVFSMNRINVICLGVRNMEKSVKFYRDGLGFNTQEKENNPAVIFFNNYGSKLELYPLELLAQDANTAPPQTDTYFSGVTLAYNVKTKAEVLEVVEVARKAGAKILKEPQDVFWGGFHAYFSDLDGYCWEVVWGPNFEFDENDMLKL